MAAYFNIGKFVAIHGLQGELLLQHELGKKSSLKGLTALFIEDRNKSFLPYFIQQTRIKSDDEVFIKLEGVDTREQALQFSRKQAWVPETDFKKLAAKSAPASLLGYQIIDNDTPLGEILELIEQPHQLLCRLDVRGKEVLVPLNESSLQSVDHRNKKVHVSLPEGLLSIYLGS